MRAYNRWAVLGGLVAAALFSAARPAAADGLQVRVDAVDTTHLPTVTATVTVTDSAGLPVQDLPAGAFTASVDGKPVPATGVAGAADPNLGIAVVLTFDVSGSMAGAPLEQARSAAKDLIAQLGPADQAAVLAFANDVRVVQGFTGDKGALLAAVDSLVAAGNTALYQAVRSSYETIAQAGLPRKAIVLLSDGQDFGGVSQTDRGGSLAAASQPGVAMFVVGLGASIDQPYLQQLTDASRGRLLLAPDPGALAGLYQTIGSLLRHQFVVTLDLTGIQGGPQSSLHLALNAPAGSAAVDVPLNLPAPPSPVVTPQPTPVITPVPQPEPQAGTESGGGLAWPVPLAIGGGIGAIGLASFVIIRRRRRPAALTSPGAVEESLEERIQGPTAPQAPEGPLFPASAPLAMVAPDSWLHLREAGADRRFPLGERPITIGFTEDCDIQLPDGNGVRIERVRVWRRDGRYMIHNVSRLGHVSVSGTPLSWAVLEDGDEIQVGSCILKFESRASGTPQ